MAKNLGQIYEEKIRLILARRNLLPLDLHGNDAGFIHKGNDYYLEIKNESAPDYGQRGLKWSIRKGWEWRKKDELSKIFDEYGVIDHIDPDFIPRRHTIPESQLTIEDKKYDQKMVKKSGIPIKNIDILFDYYALKGCYYLQMEEMGFYYLKEDIARLKVLNFNQDRQV